MKHSTDGILTTHTGSLPRPDDLVGMVEGRDQREAGSDPSFQSRVTSAVKEIVQKQVAAGIDCVEHATGLTEELIPQFAERGVAIVPTLVNIATFPKLAQGGEAKFPRWADHMRRLHKRRYDTVLLLANGAAPP